MTVDEMKKDIAELTAQHNQLEQQRNNAETLRLKTLGAIEALSQLVTREEKKAAEAAKETDKRAEVDAQLDGLRREIAAEAISGEPVPSP